MQVDNLTANQYDLPGGIQIAPNASNFVIADADFNANDTLRKDLSALVAAGSLSVDTAPAGYYVQPGVGFVQSHGANSLSATATATNAIATATIAAQGAGSKVAVDRVRGGFSAAPAAPTNLQIKDGSTVIWQEPVTAAGSFDINLTDEDLRASDNAALSAVLGAGGAAVIGYVDLIGHVE